MFIKPVIGEPLLRHRWVAFEECLIVWHDERFATNINIDERMDVPRD
jgi:hypothetical protein